MLLRRKIPVADGSGARNVLKIFVSLLYGEHVHTHGSYRTNKLAPIMTHNVNIVPSRDPTLDETI